MFYCILLSYLCRTQALLYLDPDVVRELNFNEDYSRFEVLGAAGIGASVTGTDSELTSQILNPWTQYFNTNNLEEDFR